jgi:hypothetical protein
VKACSELKAKLEAAEKERDELHGYIFDLLKRCSDYIENNP